MIKLMSFVMSFSCQSISTVDDVTSASFSQMLWSLQASLYSVVLTSSTRGQNIHAVSCLQDLKLPQVVRSPNYLALGHLVLVLQSLCVLLDATGNI